MRMALSRKDSMGVARLGAARSARTPALRRLVGLGALAWLPLLPAAAAPRLVFRAGFDRSDRLVDYAGGNDLAACRQVRLAPGKFGQALEIATAENDAWLDAYGNLDKARGALSLWYKPGPEADAAISCPLFWSDDSTNRVWTGIRLVYANGRVSFDISHPQGPIVTKIDEKGRDGWIHIVANWDCAQGHALLINGRPVGEKKATWTPRHIPQLLVGGDFDEGKGGNCAHGWIDELRIYDSPLTQEQAAALGENRLELSNGKAPTEGWPELRPMGSPAAAPPKETFRLAFEQGLVAVSPSGPVKPIRASALKIVAGFSGNGARFADGDFLEFASKGVVSNSEGTIAFWHKPDWSGKLGAGACLFHENGSDLPDSNVMRLFIRPTGQLEFNPRAPGIDAAQTPGAPFRLGQWTHTAISWDCRRNRTLYVDGRLMASGRSELGWRKGFLPLTWTPKEPASFFLGAQDAEGRLGARGTFDEIRLFDRMMTPEQVADLYGSCLALPVRVVVEDPYPVEGKKDACKARLENLSDKPLDLQGRWETRDTSGAALQSGPVPPIHLAPRGMARVSFDVTARDDSPLTLVVTVNADGKSLDHQETLWPVAAVCRRSVGESLKLKPIENIDLSKPLGADRFVDSDGKSRIEQSPLGAYREAGPQRNSRFAVRFHVNAVGKTHRLVWKYPDDKPRTMDAVLQYVKGPAGAPNRITVHAGALTGDEYPNTNRMIEQGAFFWPECEDYLVTFMTCENNRPAAVAELAVYEVEGEVPAASIQPYEGKTPARSMGLYFEDPTLRNVLGVEAAFPDFRHAGDRLAAYMAWFGQNLFLYPTVWYHGPLYESAVEPYEDDLRGRPHPPFFQVYLAKRLAAEGMSFVPLFNIQQLPGLNDAAIIDERKIQQGAETPINVLWNNHLKTFGWHGSDPAYNCLDPAVQGQLLNLAQETVDRLQDSPAFKGIALHVTRHSLFWFGSLDSGYNGQNLEAFQRDTGLRIPVDPRDPARFYKSYQWLMANAKEKWIDWRCRQLRGFYGRMADVITRARPDAKLIIKLSEGHFQEYAADTFHHPDGYRQTMRQAGLDLALFADAPGISLQRTDFPADYRWQRGRWGDRPEFVDTRTHCLATRTYTSLAALPDIGLNLHDRYWENLIGRTQPIKNLWGAKEHGWRTPTLNPSPDSILEDYSAPLGSADFSYFTKGGIVLGFWGVEQPILEFAKAFRALPAVRFQDVPSLADPATVRFAKVDGRPFFYAVNRFAYPVRCDIHWRGSAATIFELAPEKLAALSNPLRVELAPYQLRSFRVEGGDFEVMEGTESVDPNVSSRLLAELERRTAMVASRGGDAMDSDELQYYVRLGREMANQGHWAQLESLLQESWTRRLDAAAGAEPAAPRAAPDAPRR